MSGSARALSATSFVCKYNQFRIFVQFWCNKLLRFLSDFQFSSKPSVGAAASSRLYLITQRTTLRSPRGASPVCRYGRDFRKFRTNKDKCEMLCGRWARRFSASREVQQLGLFGVKNLINSKDFDGLTDRAINRCDQLRYLLISYHSLTQ